LSDAQDFTYSAIENTGGGVTGIDATLRLGILRRPVERTCLPAVGHAVENHTRQAANASWLKWSLADIASDVTGGDDFTSILLGGALRSTTLTDPPASDSDCYLFVFFLLSIPRSFL
jgi:hypothetical protein